jgi:signal transduction histidine kinase
VQRSQQLVNRNLAPRDVQSLPLGQSGRRRRNVLISGQYRLEPSRPEAVLLHKVFLQFGEAMLRASNRAELFESISSVAEKSGVFSAISVSLLDQQTGRANSCMCHCAKGTPACFTAELSKHLGEIERTGNEALNILVFNELCRDSVDFPWLMQGAAAGHGAMAVLPIANRQEVIGRLIVLSRKPHFFDHESLNLLRQLATDLSFLLARFDNGSASCGAHDDTFERSNHYRALLEHLHDAREDERRLISREFHDELGQTLSALKIDIIGLERDMSTSDAKCANRIVHMKALIVEALEETRRILAAKGPRILEELSLGSALQWLTAEFSMRTEIPCHSTIEMPKGRYVEIVATTAFRCVQECLTNITRHAAATTVYVTARQTANILNLCIVDNGVGLPADFSERGRFGLLGLRERVQAQGGQLDVESQPNRGTTIKISLPATPPATVEGVNPLRRLKKVVAPVDPPLMEAVD